MLLCSTALMIMTDFVQEFIVWSKPVGLAITSASFVK